MFDASQNDFSGAVPIEYSRLPNLSSIRLQENQLTGALPDMPAGIGRVDVSNNNFTGPIPPSYSQFTDLVVLNVSQNALNGSLPDPLPNTTLALDARDNELTGAIPESYEGL